MPGEQHPGEDRLGREQRNHRGAGRNQGHNDVGGPEALALAHTLQPPVARGGGRASQKLAVGGGHDGAEHRRDHQARQYRGQKGGGGLEQDRLRVSQAGKQHPSGQAQRGHAGEHQHHPGEGDDPALTNGLVVPSRHVAVDHMRLSGLGKTHGKAADHESQAGNARVGGRQPQRTIVGKHSLRRSAQVREGEQGDCRQGDCHENHQQALQRVGNAHRQEASKQRIGQDDRGPQNDAGVAGQAQRLAEGVAGGLELRGDIEHERNQDDQRSDLARGAPHSVVAVAQEQFGKGQRAGPACDHAQPRPDPEPVDDVAQDHAAAKPDGRQSLGQRKTADAKQGPGRCRAGRGTDGRDPGADAPAAQEELALVLRTAPCPQADAEQDQLVADQRCDYGCVATHVLRRSDANRLSRCTW